VPFGRVPASDHIGRPCQQQTKRIAEIVTGIGQQRDRIGGESVEHLRGDEGEVQQRRGGKRKAEVPHVVRMTVPVIMGRSMCVSVSLSVAVRVHQHSDIGSFAAMCSPAENASGPCRRFYSAAAR